MNQTKSKFDVRLAQVCMNCPMCRRARRKQKGAAYQMVKAVEHRVCPFCRAYERIHRRKAYEALPQP